MVDEATFRDADAQSALPHAPTEVVIFPAVGGEALVEQSCRLKRDGGDQHGDEAHHSRLVAETGAAGVLVRVAGGIGDGRDDAVIWPRFGLFGERSEAAWRLH